MNALVIPDGFELVIFPWDRLPAFVRGADRGAATPPAAYVALHLSALPPRFEYAAPGIEEEPERWDGLS